MVQHLRTKKSNIVVRTLDNMRQAILGIQDISAHLMTVIADAFSVAAAYDKNRG
jgi:hypothetical protein